MYFWVDDVDALYREFVERGAKTITGYAISRTVVANSVRRI